jgi:redox-sensing transcriptional repressor
MGISKVSSKDLGQRMGITSSQVRQDLLSFGDYGQQGYGYDVEFLCQEIGYILGLNTVRQMIIIGAGSLGHALAKYFESGKNGFKVVAVFDIRQEVVGEKINELEIMHFDNAPEFLANHRVDIAALTVPENHAKKVAEYITRLGIKAIWNFVPIGLKSSDDVMVENIHLIDSLMVLGYKLQNKK